MHVESPKRECATEAERWQRLFAEGREMSQTASHQLAEVEHSFQHIQSKLAAATTETNEWRELATEAAEELKVAHADVPL